MIQEEMDLSVIGQRMTSGGCMGLGWYWEGGAVAAGEEIGVIGGKIIREYVRGCLDGCH